MSRSRSLSASVATVAVLALSGGLAVAQEPETAEVLELSFPVLDLETETASLDSSVNRVEAVEDVRVTLAADVLFRFNSARLGGSAPKRLTEAVRDIRSLEPDEVTVLGYTDSKGSTGYNAGLSRRRAEAVGQALARELGGGGPELSTEGRGEADPVAPNQTEDGEDNPAGRKRNRRVEIRIPKR